MCGAGGDGARKAHLLMCACQQVMEWLEQAETALGKAKPGHALHVLLGADAMDASLIQRLVDNAYCFHHCTTHAGDAEQAPCELND